MSPWRLLVSRFSDRDAFRGLAIDANDGIIATAGLLQGFAGAGAGDQLLLFAATAAMLAGGLSRGRGKVGGGRRGARGAMLSGRYRVALTGRAALPNRSPNYPPLAFLAPHWQADQPASRDWPPSIQTSVPVMWPAASEARKQIRSATCSDVPGLSRVRGIWP